MGGLIGVIGNNAMGNAISHPPKLDEDFVQSDT